MLCVTFVQKCNLQQVKVFIIFISHLLFFRSLCGLFVLNYRELKESLFGCEVIVILNEHCICVCY